MKKILLALALVLVSALPAIAQEAPHIKLRLIPERNTIQSGEGLWVLIEETITPGWHTYWVNPGDSGAAQRIKWTMPEGFETSDISWPAPHKISVEGLVSYGYEDKVTIGQSILAPVKKMPKGKLEFKADFEILVCKDICIPEKYSETLVLNDPAAQAENQEEAVDTFFNDLPIQSDWSATYRIEDKNFVALITGLNADAIDLKSIDFMPVEWGIVKNAAPLSAKIVTEQKKGIEITQAYDNRDMKDVKNLIAVMSYKDSDGKLVNIKLPMKPDANIPVTDVKDGPDVKKNTEVSRNNDEVKTTLVQAILFALFGGLILNLMPCVFPILSIKALSLIKLREKGWRFSAANGLAYTLGVLATFATIGGLLMSVKIAGGDIGWGFQLQDPVIVLGLVYLLFVIGLNLSGLFDINASFMGAGASFANKHGFAGSFFTGVLATVVATPCTAPFMAGALGYALLQPPAVAMCVFVALGFGLALPYLLLSVIPTLAGILPRPGSWMIKFRELLAFPIYASATWLLWVLSMQTGTPGLLWSMFGLIAIAFALWLLMHKPVQIAGRATIIMLALIAFLFAALPFIDKTLLHKPAITSEQSINAYTPAKLAELLKGNDPVFVYMTASWCITCKVNERIAINTDATRAMIADHKVAVLEGDWTNMNPDITKFLKTYGRAGVPLYIYYGPRDGASGQRPEPVTLPQILTPHLMNETFAK